MKQTPDCLYLFLAGILSVFLGSCAVLNSKAINGGIVEPDWKTGDEWKVRIKAWPDRYANPYAESAEMHRTVWTYRVLETPESDSGHRILVKRDRETFLLRFNEDHNLLNVNQIIGNRGESWKLKRILDSPTQGGAFLSRGWTPGKSGIWVHPDLSTSESFKRFNYTSGGRPTRRWMIQKVKRNKNGIKFILKNDPNNLRAVIHWNPDQDWWSEAVYFHRKRLILKADRVRE